MNDITLTIDGLQVKGNQGDTVLDVCQANGIDVPTLCHLEGLSDVGACRMCVVEIQGERRPVPSCTYPIRDGLIVQTKTERLEKYRRQVLELLFAERNHFCMFCEQSGDCELQAMGYRYRMDNVRYPYNFPHLPVDSSHDYLVLDHNRCILCGRCIRACSEVAASGTLGFSQRGWNTVVSADIGQPLGESSCLSCGVCVQVCPTGALFNKISLYKAKSGECQRLKTICPECGIGCEIEVLVKDNHVVRIESPNLTSPRSALCRMGRFDLLRSTLPRITSPLIRTKGGKPKECTVDEAVQAIVTRFSKIKDGFAGIASSRLPSETLIAFRKFVSGVTDSGDIDTLDGERYRIINEGIRDSLVGIKGLNMESAIEEILQADCILLVGADVENANPIVGTLIRRAVNQNHARLIVIDSSRDVMPLWVTVQLKPKTNSEGDLLGGLGKFIIDKGVIASQRINTDVVKAFDEYDISKVMRSTGVDKSKLTLAAEMYGQAKRSILIYGEELLSNNDAGVVTTLLNLACLTGSRAGSKLGVISLKPHVNSRGAWELGLAKGINRSKLKTLYLLLADEMVDGKLLDWLQGVDFLVVQASYHSSVTSIADVVLPSPLWAERKGKYVTMDGRVVESKCVLQPQISLPEDEEILAKISRKLGH